MIETYNAGSRNIEELFEELLTLSRTLNEEQQRHVRENMTEEELVIFDILTRPAPELSADERAEVKKVARELLERTQAAAGAQLAAEVHRPFTAQAHHRGRARQGLPRAYTPELYQQKCSAVFEHVYESYGDRGASLYRSAG